MGWWERRSPLVIRSSFITRSESHGFEVGGKGLVKIGKEISRPSSDNMSLKEPWIFEGGVHLSHIRTHASKHTTTIRETTNNDRLRIR